MASADEERRLSQRRRAGLLPFDARPVPPASLNDLDLDLFAREYLPAILPVDVLEANQRTPVERLAALRLATLAGVPTAAGVLVLGTEPSRWIAGAAVQFLRVQGGDLTAPISDEKRLDAPLPILLRQLDDVLTINIKTAVEIGTRTTDVRAPDFPLVAFLAALGYVQRFGVGLSLARRAVAEGGNGDLAFEVDPAYVAVTIRAAK